MYAPQKGQHCRILLAVACIAIANSHAQKIGPKVVCEQGIPVPEETPVEGTLYRYLAFKTPGAERCSVTFESEVTCDVLLIGGGGGGGSARGGGGGGGGGLVFHRGLRLVGTYSVSVGSGGDGGIPEAPGAEGTESSVASATLMVIAKGGGYGGQLPSPKGSAGGSGGGSRVNYGGDGGASTQDSGDGLTWRGHGNKGGDCSGNTFSGAGGGGAGNAGEDCALDGAGGEGLDRVQLNGETLLFSDLFGTMHGHIADSMSFFAGGGGAGEVETLETAGKNKGGLGGGGGGSSGSTKADDGLPNTGGGGGGSGYKGSSGFTLDGVGGNGGSGIILLRFLGCFECEAGAYPDGCVPDYPGACTACPGGTYKETSGSQECSICEGCGAGTFRKECGLADPGACTECSAGTFKNATGAQECSACESCGVGEYRAGCGNDAPGACVACPEGRYKDNVGAQECAMCGDCDAGTHRTACGSGVPGACTACPGGTYKETSGSQECSRCGVCLPGAFRKECGLADPGACTECSAGTFKNVTGAQECSACEFCGVGEYRAGCGSGVPGMCTECPEGKYKDAVSAQECAMCGDCDAGTYRDGCGSGVPGGCTACPGGTYKETSGSQECSSCGTCSAGTFSGGCGLESPGSCLACAECEANQYFSAGCMCSNCTICPEGAVEERQCSRTADRTCSCPEGSCCPHSLSDYADLDPYLNSIYGDRKVKLDPIVETMPTTKINCDQVPEFLVSADDVLASSSKLYGVCADRCQEKDIGIMTGTGYSGLNLANSMDVCLGSTDEMTREDEELCREYDDNMCVLEQSTLRVVNSLSRVSYASLAKQTSTLQLVIEAREEALDPEKQDLLTDETDSGVPRKILEIYSNILRKYASEDDELAQALEGLEGDFDRLDQDFKTNFDKINESLEKCPTMTLRTDDEDNILYDICSQQSLECIEGEEAEHVACCCVYNPMAELPGLHLQALLDLVQCTFHDICSEHRVDMNAWIASAGFDSKVDVSVYQKFAKSLQNTYGASFRPLDTFQSLQPQQDTSYTTASAFEPQTVTDCPAVKIRDVETGVPSHLPDLAEDTYGTLDIVYDFSGNVEGENWCDRRFQNDGELFSRCEKFCGPTSVPLMVGSPRSGVNIHQALSVCFDPDVVGPAQDQAFCSGPGREALRKLQLGIADLASNMTVLKISRVVFADYMRTASAEARQNADSTDLKDAIQRQNSESDRVQTYKDFYSSQFDGMHQKARALQYWSQRVKESFEHLKLQFDESLPDLERYSAKCSRGFPRSEDGHAVLSICPVSGTVCADSDQSSYVYCCCSTNILAEHDTPIDVCSHAKNQSAEFHDEIFGESIERRALATYLGRYQEGLVGKYGVDLDYPLSFFSFGGPPKPEVRECPEAEKNNCDENAECLPSLGGYECVCSAGFATLDEGVTCTSVEAMHRVELQVTLPYSRAQFDEGRQEAFRRGVASAAGVSVARVLIQVYDSRRNIDRDHHKRSLLTDSSQSSIRVVTQIVVPTKQDAQSLLASGRLDSAQVNAALVAQGIEPAATVSTPTVAAPTQPKSLAPEHDPDTGKGATGCNGGCIAGAALGSLGGVAFLAGVGYAAYKKRDKCSGSGGDEDDIDAAPTVRSDARQQQDV